VAPYPRYRVIRREFFIWNSSTATDKREQQEREERTRNIIVYQAKDEARENKQQAEQSG
jgi:hypothetical protein